MSVKKLLYKKSNANEYYTRFFSELSSGDYFTYGEAWTPQEIVELADKYGVKVSYCNSKSDGYIKHGCFTMEVS